jgi:hypothetical protein
MGGKYPWIFLSAAFNAHYLRRDYLNYHRLTDRPPSSDVFILRNGGRKAEAYSNIVEALYIIRMNQQAVLRETGQEFPDENTIF